MHNSADIARVRRFYRAATRDTGALDQSFLGRGRPLGPARVLHSVAPEGTPVDTIRTYLDLDKTLLSRFLRGLADEGLVTLDTDPDDRRRRIVRLTDTGRTEQALYNKLSDDHAAALLSRAKDRTALLAAMDLITMTLNQTRITLRETDPQHPDAVACLEAYYAELAARFETGFDVSLSRDPDAADMRSPRGAFLVAYRDDAPIGCVGLKGSDKGYAEVKRLWVSPDARGLGLAKRLMDATETAARALGIVTLRLDTNSSLPDAVRLYQSTGWTALDRFNDDPYPDYFFEKHL
ncbi:GNAT family N-acetyltransferase [Shimia sp. FJ5]|uniref:GNAT family N-acetyltransferase n=1 Tax=Shimia sp. FJ5 TaxID=3079054 RepID=UPI00293DD536|nr:GNAT family N-acetyltransferase [Shimia sp. FJ5]MDV4145144.1 GNAT family N-acetyltransferase [Shimia sp. FJ5]